MVFGVSFFGRYNVTADPRVRAAFQRALYVSAGVAYINSAVATPDQDKMCGVNVTNTGGFGRRALLAYEALSEAAVEQIAAAARRMEVFGESNFTVMQKHVNDLLREMGGNAGSFTTAETTPPPDTNVYFSVVSNVEGTIVPALYFFWL